MCLLLVATAAACPCACGDESAASLTELVLVGRQPIAAEWTGGSSGALEFRTAAGDKLAVADELVRWGAPAEPRGSAMVLLADGSQLTLAESWLGDPPLTLAGDGASANSETLGKIPLQRRQLAAAFWNLPRELSRRGGLVAHLQRAAATAPDRDCILLSSGDVVRGEVLAIGATNNIATDKSQASVSIRTELGMLELPLTRLSGLQFRAAATSSAVGPAASAQAMLRDGSRLCAAELVAEPSQWQVRTACGAAVVIAAPRDVVGLQGHGSRVVYLSDATPTSFSHDRQFAVRWSLVRDAAVAGGPLQVRGRLYAKGLAMHAPSRAEFAIPAGAQRFAAAVAIDDSATGGGSVDFQILVRHNDSQEWTEAAVTATIRGNDSPQRMTVDVTSADHIALVTATADRGDELDRAVWLDARFELVDE